MEQTAVSKYNIVPKWDGLFSLWKTIDSDDSRKEVLVVLFGFLRATPRIIAKYCDIYLKRGWHVLFVPGYARHFLWPRSSIRLGEDLMEYLNKDASEYSHFIVHAISMGSLNFSVFTHEVLSKASEKYGYIKFKIKAIVYDSIGFSIGSSDSMIRGVLKEMGLHTFSNIYLKRLFPKLMMAYCFFMHNCISLRFEHLAHMVQTKPLEVPTLFFYCKIDPIANYKDIRELVAGYRRIGSFPVLDKYWCESRHAAHLIVNKADYLDNINRLFTAIPELCDPPKSKL